MAMGSGAWLTGGGAMPDPGGRKICSPPRNARLIPSGQKGALNISRRYVFTWRGSRVLKLNSMSTQGSICPFEFLIFCLFAISTKLSPNRPLPVFATVYGDPPMGGHGVGCISGSPSEIKSNRPRHETRGAVVKIWKRLRCGALVQKFHECFGRPTELLPLAMNDAYRPHQSRGVQPHRRKPALRRLRDHRP